MSKEHGIEEFAPAFYAPKLQIGTGRMDVGLCTQWTKEDVLQTVLAPDEYGVRGPLYSGRGVEYIMRNCLANPVVRHIVLTGSNANDSGEALVAVAAYGVGEKNQILKLDDERGKPRVFFDPGLPAEAVDIFRERVEIIDLRDEKNWRKVVERMKEIPEQGHFFDIRRHYPETMPSMNVLPSEKVGIRIERRKIADAWLDMLHHIRQFGVVKPTDKGRNIQELASLHIVVHEDPNTMLDQLPEWLPVSRGDVESYLPVMMEPKPPVGVDVAYTYGAQLQNYEGINQLEMIEELVRSEWYTKRAVATTWHLPNHLTDQVASAPCLVDMMFLVQDDQLYTTAHFRSHDMYRAWLQNVYGLRSLQSRMAKNIGMPVGPLEIISNSAHLWQDVVPDADRLLADRYSKLAASWREDPRGNFVITVTNGVISAKHADVNGNFTGKEFTGMSGQDLYREIILKQSLISLPDHAAYIAWELSRAELAAKLGQSYSQDQA